MAMQSKPEKWNGIPLHNISEQVHQDKLYQSPEKAVASVDKDKWQNIQAEHSVKSKRQDNTE